MGYAVKLQKKGGEREEYPFFPILTTSQGTNSNLGNSLLVTTTTTIVLYVALDKGYIHPVKNGVDLSDTIHYIYRTGVTNMLGYYEFEIDATDTVSITCSSTNYRYAVLYKPTNSSLRLHITDNLSTYTFTKDYRLCVWIGTIYNSAPRYVTYDGTQYNASIIGGTLMYVYLRNVKAGKTITMPTQGGSNMMLYV